jgi:uncharacterized protein Yka (UPF0111/DUF47 family)
VRQLSIARTEERFYQLFETAAGNLGAAATLLAAMLHDTGDLPARAATMKEHEHTGDVLTEQLFTFLHQTAFPPLAPDMIQRLTSALDDVMDALHATAQQLLIFRVDQSRPEAAEIGQLLVQAVRELATALPLLRRRSDRPRLQSHIAELHRLENEVDRVTRNGLAAVIARRDAFDLIRWKAVYEQLERAADRCEDVADVFDAVMSM